MYNKTVLDSTFVIFIYQNNKDLGKSNQPQPYPGSRGDLQGERSDGERAKEKTPLVESVGNLTSMLSPSTEIEPRR